MINKITKFHIEQNPKYTYNIQIKKLLILNKSNNKILEYTLREIYFQYYNFINYLYRI